MVVGVAVGYLFPDSSSGFHATSLQVFSAVFLRLIKCLIAPLLFATLVVGIAGHGDDLTRVGKLAFRSLVYFEIVTTLALVVGLVAVNLVKPGLGVNLAVATTETGIDVAAKPTFAGTLEHIVPVSFFDAAARNEALQITFFAIMFAVALSQVPPHHKKLMLGFCESLSEVMLKFVGFVMKFAPVGIGAAMAVTVGRNGLGVLKNLGALVFTLYGALVVFALVVLLPIAILFKVPLRRFWETIKEPFLLPSPTASSEGGTPPCAPEPGEARRAKAHRRLRAAHRLRLQHGRQHALPGDGIDLRGTGRRDSHAG
jgi:proton glutamate symport protein